MVANSLLVLTFPENFTVNLCYKKLGVIMAPPPRLASKKSPALGRVKNIKAMYENISYKIKLGDGYLDPITSNLGLKQGCPLSPMLFNLYIDDVGDIFDAD